MTTNTTETSTTGIRAHLRHHRLPLAGMAMLLAVSLLASPAGAAPPDAEKPTIVLVHGAWADPGGWDLVARRLERDGFTTVSPRLDLLGIESDAAVVSATLDAIPGDKVVVAHSYGGIVATNAVFGRSDVRALVFTAAFVPDEGDSIVRLGEGYTPTAVLAHLDWVGEPFASPAYIERAAFPAVFAGDLGPNQAARLNAGQQPASPAILFSPSGPAAWHQVPLWYAVSGADLVIDPAQQRWMAGRANATIVEFRDASHAGGYTRYARQFTALIERAVRMTAG